MGFNSGFKELTYSSETIYVHVFLNILFYFIHDMVAVFLHRSLTPVCYSHRFRGGLILYWFWIASNMATRRVRLFSLHERWFITAWIQASSFTAMLLQGSLTVSDFSPWLSFSTYPSFFSAFGPQNRNVPQHPPTNLSIFCVFTT